MRATSLTVAAAVVSLTTSTWAQTAPTAGASAATTQPATQAAALPHLRLDLEAGVVDVDAKVVLREGEWLELLACTPGSREHESILTVQARPSHIHLALLMLGLEPGAPLKAEWLEDRKEIKATPPHGPRVAITLLVERDGKTVETPANDWIVNQKTKEPMADNHWLFAGSQTKPIEGQDVYFADLNGTVIALVNFGDDLLTRPTDLTNQNDHGTWGPRTEAIPPVGTAVTVRLRPVKEEAGAATRPSER